MVNRLKYGKTGNLKAKDAFEDVQMAGITKSYYENGMLKMVTTIYVKDMKLYEPAKSCCGNGKVKQETIYKDGKPVGPSKHYDKNGKVK